MCTNSIEIDVCLIGIICFFLFGQSNIENSIERRYHSIGVWFRWVFESIVLILLFIAILILNLFFSVLWDWYFVSSTNQLAALNIRHYFNRSNSNLLFSCEIGHKSDIWLCFFFISTFCFSFVRLFWMGLYLLYGNIKQEENLTYISVLLKRDKHYSQNH